MENGSQEDQSHGGSSRSASQHLYPKAMASAKKWLGSASGGDFEL